jgi:hypothetical protein
VAATAAVVAAAVGAAAAASAVAALLTFAQAALADEAGVSFWVPGTFASFAATRTAPGWSAPLVYYHRATDSRDEDLVHAVPTYVPSAPIDGAQATMSLGIPFGRVSAGNDSRTSVGDLYPALTLKSGGGERSYMSYTMLGVPTGPSGTNHWSIDGGGGFTFLNERTGREFSAVLGFTYNFRNPDTDYRNGASSHLDWAASQPVSPMLRAGMVGYFYYQLGEDHGPGASKSRVYAVGPQAEWTFDKWRVNLRGYYEFVAHNRPEGWNARLSVAFPL